MRDRASGRAVGTAVVVLTLLGTACAGDTGDDRAEGAGREENAPEPTVAAAPPGTAPETMAPEAAERPDDLDLPASPDEAAATITRVERELRRDTPSAEELRVLGWEQQHAYRALSVHPEWIDSVRAAVPAELAPVVDANLAAVTEIAVLNQPQPSVPDWLVAAPDPLGVLLGYYREAEAASGIPWRYLAAIHLVETRMGRIRGTSSAGAQGPMQFIPETWARFGAGDVNENRDAILAAGRYLDASGGPEDMERALYAYNNSERYVAAIRSYADLIAADERVVRGYYEWQVYYATVDGVVLLPEGYPTVAAVDVPGPGSR